MLGLVSQPFFFFEWGGEKKGVPWQMQECVWLQSDFNSHEESMNPFFLIMNASVLKAKSVSLELLETSEVQFNLTKLDLGLALSRNLPRHSSQA